jgi:uncharacterized Zn finger protein
MGDWDFGWRPYVSVAERQLNAMREMEKRRKKGLPVSPVVIDGRAIARTFWGKAWCENLERYSDYSNRLPRGRTYVRNGSVVDLRIEPGAVHASVAGSDLYEVTIRIAPLAKPRWKAICSDCAGAIDSLVELLQGRLSDRVMERVCRKDQGLFPTPREIKLGCSCPDWAEMCKHVAAVLYGIGARLDRQPELLFKLRAVEAQKLIAQAGSAAPLSRHATASARILSSGVDLAGVFGLDMAGDSAPVAAPTKPKARKTATGRKAVKAAAGKSTPAKKKAIRPIKPARRKPRK